MVGGRSLQDDVGGVEASPVRRPVRERTTCLLLALVALASCGAALAKAIAYATRHQIDFDIYRMGAADVFGQSLYQARLPAALMGGSQGMHFTYPPFAALAFWPFAQLSLVTSQITWALVNFLALGLLAALSIRMVRPGWPLRRLLYVTALLLFPILLLEPNSLTLAYGQVNIIVVLLATLDFAGEVHWRSRRLPQGILLGIAAAIKLTPLIFIPFLFLTRQVRAGVTALTSFLVCALGAFLMAPRSSWLYWSTEIFDSKRSGNLLYISNQDLHYALQRVIGAPPPLVILVPLTVVFGAVGLAIATWAYRASSLMAGILVCAATGLTVSPVSWAHHYVWVVPALAWLTLGRDRPAGGPLWALGAAVLFWVAPIWRVPDVQSGYGGPLTLIEGNSFFLAATALLVLVGVMLWARGRSARQPGVVAAGVSPAGADSPVRQPRAGAGSGLQATRRRQAARTVRVW